MQTLGLHREEMNRQLESINSFTNRMFVVLTIIGSAMSLVLMSEGDPIQRVQSVLGPGNVELFATTVAVLVIIYLLYLASSVAMNLYYLLEQANECEYLEKYVNDIVADNIVRWEHETVKKTHKIIRKDLRYAVNPAAIMNITSAIALLIVYLLMIFIVYTVSDLWVLIVVLVFTGAIAFCIVYSLMMQYQRVI